MSERRGKLLDILRLHVLDYRGYTHDEQIRPTLTEPAAVDAIECLFALSGDAEREAAVRVLGEAYIAYMDACHALFRFAGTRGQSSEWLAANGGEIQRLEDEKSRRAEEKSDALMRVRDIDAQLAAATPKETER